MQMNCIGCASDVPPERRNEWIQPTHEIPHVTQLTHTCRAVLWRRLFSPKSDKGRSAAKTEAQRRRDVSRIKENKRRSLIKRRFLSKTHMPESNKTKDNDNKIKQN
jgi:hypothetical protein